MDRGDLKSSVQRHLGGRTNADAVLRVDEALNLGLKQLARRHEWRDLQTTTDLSMIRNTLSPALINGTWTEATLTLVDSDSPFTAYLVLGFKAGDKLYLTDGTGTDAGYYSIASITDADTIVMAESIATDGVSDVDGTKIINFKQVALPSATNQLLSAILINDTNSCKLIIKSKRWLINRYPYIESASANTPIYGYVEKGWLFFYPNSNAEYDIRVTTDDIPSDFADDDAENPIPALDLSLISWATAYCLGSFGEFQKSNFYYNRVEVELKNAIHRDGSKKEERSLDQGLEPVESADSAYTNPFAKRSP